MHKQRHNRLFIIKTLALQRWDCVIQVHIEFGSTPTVISIARNLPRWH